MADGFGNYITGLDSVTIATSGSNAPILHGTGAPPATVPDYARGWIDDTTGTLYVRKSDSTWTAVSGSGGGSGTVTTSASDPTGVLVVTGPAICIGTGAVDGLLWKKTSAGAASDWVQM